MNVLLLNYVFNHAAKTITLTDYSSSGITLAQLQLIYDATLKKFLFNSVDPTLTATVSGNIVTLTAVDTSIGSYMDTDQLYIVYADPNAIQPVGLGSDVMDDRDSISANPKASTPHVITATANVIANSCKLSSMTFGATGGTIQAFDSATNTTSIPLTPLLTPTAQTTLILDNIQATTGIYIVISGTVNVSVNTKPNSA